MAILFALAIVLPFMAVAPAFASTSYSALTSPTVESGKIAELGTLYIKIDPMADNSAALVSLPSNYEILEINGVAVNRAVDASMDFDAATVKAFVFGFDDNEFKLEITAPAPAVKKEVYIKLKVDVPSGASGDVIAEITNLSGQLSSGTVVVGVVDKGAVTVSCSTPEYISNDGTITITIRENAAGALDNSGSPDVKLTLPKGYYWSNTVTKKDNLNGTVAYTAARDATNNRVINVDVTAAGTKSIIRFDATIVVDEIDAKHGDIEVTVGGKAKTSPSKLTVAKYADFGYKVDVEDATEVLAGRYDDIEIGDIIIEETAPNSLVRNRTILLTLPTGAKWVKEPTTDCTNSLNVVFDDLTSDRQTAKYTVTAISTDKAGKVTFEDGEIATAVTFSGDLGVKISGSAGVTGDAKVAAVKAPITATADKPNVKIGVQGQAAGDITITEAEAEALIKDKTLTLKPAIAGVSFYGTPKVDVVEGDIEVDMKKNADADELTLTIDSESTIASTIKISNITYTVNRAYPEGDVKLNFTGYAVDEVNDDTVLKTRPIYKNDQWFDKDETAASVINAICVTPAPGDAKQDAKFVIGSTTYTVDGVEQTMDVAPYVKDGRTYLPVRYVGLALGVDAKNIMWDSASGTVTLIKGDKVVQVTVGSKNMVINGATIAMDAAPEITNGRTMLPFRWIAWAFGANVEWDGATQTVTMEL